MFLFMCITNKKQMIFWCTGRRPKPDSPFPSRGLGAYIEHDTGEPKVEVSVPPPLRISHLSSSSSADLTSEAGNPLPKSKTFQIFFFFFFFFFSSSSSSFLLLLPFSSFFFIHQLMLWSGRETGAGGGLEG